MRLPLIGTVPHAIEYAAPTFKPPRLPSLSMGNRNCAIEGCNALEFRTTGVCNRHKSMGIEIPELASEIEQVQPAGTLPERSDLMGYENMTVAELKNLLRGVELPISGKKADLIARLSENGVKPRKGYKHKINHITWIVYSLLFGYGLYIFELSTSDGSENTPLLGWVILIFILLPVLDLFARFRRKSGLPIPHWWSSMDVGPTTRETLERSKLSTHILLFISAIIAMFPLIIWDLGGRPPPVLLGELVYIQLFFSIPMGIVFFIVSYLFLELLLWLRKTISTL